MNNTNLKLYPDLNQVLQDVVSSIQSILTSDFTGVYLQGSFATGGFDEHSDVDFLVVIEKEITPDQLE